MFGRLGWAETRLVGPAGEGRFQTLKTTPPDSLLDQMGGHGYLAGDEQSMPAPMLACSAYLQKPPSWRDMLLEAGEAARESRPAVIM